MEATGMPEYMMTYAIKAEQLIKAENKILYWNFKYPEQFVSCDDVISSPLYWSKSIRQSVLPSYYAESIFWAPIPLC